MSFLIVVLVLGAMGLWYVAKSMDPGKTKTILWSCFAGCILLFLIIMFVTMSQHPYNPQNSYKEQQEEQWLEDNFGNGQYDEIQNAIDDYKNSNY